MQKYNICNNLSAFFIHLYLNEFTITYMKSGIFSLFTKTLATAIFCFCTINSVAQNDADFWQRLQYGGSFGVAFGSGFADVTLAPGVMYPVNDYFGVGVGLQGTYINRRDFYTSYLYGGSVIGLFNPIENIQLSAELEQLRVNIDGTDELGDYEQNFWNTGLFVGLGYRAENVTIGVRYNVLYNENDRVYNNAFMPFIRVYF